VFTSTLFGHYIPLTRLSWSLNYALGGLNPWGYHLVNVLLHAGNALAFYAVARRLLAAAVDGGGQEARARIDLSVAAAVAALGLLPSPAPGGARRLDHRAGPTCFAAPSSWSRPGFI